MKSLKKEKLSSTMKNMHVVVYVQFMLIVVIILGLILFTSVSFYENLIENINLISMGNISKRLYTIDINDKDLSDKISEIESQESRYIEIFQQKNVFDTQFTQPVYTKSINHVVRQNGQKSSTVFPYLGFKYNNFRHLATKKTDNKMSGRYTNPNTNEEFFVYTEINENENILYIISTPANSIEFTAKAISTTIVFILLIIFILIGIISYLYITRITDPLRDIRDAAITMAQTHDKSLRVPVRKSISTETKDTVESINSLYESLIITQENLREKSDFLSEQLKQRTLIEKAREEFIASTSHELKTPIAIIQGYAEGAKYITSDPSGVEEYCDIIIDECERMTSLVVNMMNLSKLQHSNDIHLEKFSVKDFIDERITLLNKTFEKNEITVENNITDDISGLADIEKMKSVINNLLSNAISYIDGNRTIRIRYEDMDLSYRIYVFNTGDQIPQGDLEKLWESFYRHDPARNRDSGHFGLGLSIVKTIQDAHSQACGVDNADGGVEFWFDICKSK